ncbi:MAG: hypothetical protein OXH85_03360 [Truepera sp.]|nr:hypothetical protein [Truepera sp.]
MARRISAETGTPAAAALARQSANSRADTRAVAVRRSDMLRFRIRANWTKHRWHVR